ncbi:unnamed protein product [Peniophora sp. CBMAI 1063]|nr:unnamed protein product [Peniophora sp. CBMAI 1063]
MASSESSGAERPFVYAVPEEDIELLQKKLALTRFPDELEDAGWEYGVPLSDIRALVERWRNGFDWRAVERSLNTLPMFIRPITVDGWGTFDVHYVHQRSDRAGAIPLLFIHGWPGSFIEVQKILPLLVNPEDPKAPAFHVVAISVLGFGPSEGHHKAGPFSLVEYAEASNKLMLALGYTEFVTQGGDLGYGISRTMASKYGPKHVKAWHTNFPSVVYPPTFFQHPILYLQNLFPSLFYSESERKGFERRDWFFRTNPGYFTMHQTKPQTLGYSLSDSPVGLLAWVYEKMVTWSDGYDWSDDEVLTWVSIYWFSRQGPTASTRIYVYERSVFQVPPPTVPMGISYFPKEIFPTPRSWARTLGNVVAESEHPDGGHFAAHERPEALVDDVRKMFGRGGPAFAVVPGRDGY